MRGRGAIIVAVVLLGLLAVATVAEAKAKARSKKAKGKPKASGGDDKEKNIEETLSKLKHQFPGMKVFSRDEINKLAKDPEQFAEKFGGPRPDDDDDL
eukprot:tig00021234_g19394.t1